MAATYKKSYSSSSWTKSYFKLYRRPIHYSIKFFFHQWLMNLPLGNTWQNFSHQQCMAFGQKKIFQPAVYDIETNLKFLNQHCISLLQNIIFQILFTDIEGTFLY